MSVDRIRSSMKQSEIKFFFSRGFELFKDHTKSVKIIEN